MARQAIDSGSAWEKFRVLVRAQGGDVEAVDDPDRLPAAPIQVDVPAPRGGYLRQIHARMVGETAVLLGGGRMKKGDPIDHAVGVMVYKKVGEQVQEGETLFTIHARREGDVDLARERLLEAVQWSDAPVDPLPLFYEVITSEEQA